MQGITEEFIAATAFGVETDSLTNPNCQYLKYAKNFAGDLEEPGLWTTVIVTFGFFGTSEFHKAPNLTSNIFSDAWFKCGCFSAFPHLVSPLEHC